MISYIVNKVFLVTIIVQTTLSLDNGLATTPPMGWMTWQRFECTTDCETYPEDCISENLVKRTADAMARDGYLAAGYNYLVIDDCWMERQRGDDEKLIPDRKRFPSGMKNVSDYVHEKTLKFGIYEDIGNKTCQGFPGSFGYEKKDVALFVEWNVDYLKLDGCHMDETMYDEYYPKFGKFLNESGRPIVYSCSWPAYQKTPNYTEIAKHCNLWRNYGDIDDSWEKVKNIMNWFADKQDELVKHAGPGHFNDPDMLQIGNFGLSLDQARIQMAIWSILAAPLFMSVDLAKIRPEFKEILLNKEIIAVDQDPLGKQGLMVHKEKYGCQVWKRDLQNDSYAVAVVYLESHGIPKKFTVSFKQMKLPQQDYLVHDLYGDEGDIILKKTDQLITRVNPTGVRFFKLSPYVEPNNKKTDNEKKTTRIRPPTTNEDCCWDRDNYQRFTLAL